MIKKPTRITLIVIGSVICILILLAVINWWGTAKLRRSFYTDKLTADDHSQLTEIDRLKQLFGEEVWPGFGHTEIPIVLFNDRYEFLVGIEEPPVGWETVSNDTFRVCSYYRRKKERSEAFAVKINDTWAGSLGSRKLMSRDFLLHARNELPPVLAQLIPYWFFTFDEGFHAAIVLHEVFHAFQAIKAPSRFVQAQHFYKFEKDYSFQNSEFIEAWNREGAILSAALEELERSSLCHHVAEFLKIRKARRSRSDLNIDLVRFEQELEWLEGLAKYTEIRIYELAAASNDKSSIASYDPHLRRWSDELRRLRSSLGEQEGDFRFYLSGMAQSRLLDRLLPDWKESVFEEGVYLENLLETACTQLDNFTR